MRHDKQMMGGYSKLTRALALSPVTIYLLTMVFVAEWNHYYLSLSNVYMATVMVAPMGSTMLLVMRRMFPNR
ncbi:MAG TPA: hypothetical protein VGR22_06160 [Thermomicrobiales bacterium]|nr:hypothetical protein [Thermomicrobiales bacterium]